MNQEVFIVFREKKYEPETQRVLAVFDTKQLADSYIENLLKNEYFRSTYIYYTIEEVLRTDLP